MTLGGSYSGTSRYGINNVSLVSPWCVTFEPFHALPWAWLEFKGAAVSVA